MEKVARVQLFLFRRLLLSGCLLFPKGANQFVAAGIRAVGISYGVLYPESFLGGFYSRVFPDFSGCHHPSN